MSSTSSADTPPSLQRLLQAGLAEVVLPFGPDLVYLFGSAVTGLAGPGSDLDVGVLLPLADPQHRRARLLALRREIVQRLDFAGVTIADLTEAEPAFLLAVVQGVCLHARSDEVRLRFETQALQEAGTAALGRQRDWRLLSAHVETGILAPPPPLPADRLERLFFTIIEQTRQLLPTAQLSPAAFLAPDHPHRRFAAAHLLRANLETVLSVVRLLTVTQGWTRSQRPDELLRQLVRHGVITADVADHLRLICLLRQPLTHPEDGIDFALVHAVIRDNLPLFATFLRQVTAYVETRGLLGP